MYPRTPTLLFLAALALLSVVEAARLPVLMTPTQRQRRASHHGLSRRQSQASPSAGPTLCVVQCPVGDKNGLSATSQDYDSQGRLVCQYDRNSPACVYSANFGVADMLNDMMSCPDVAQRICPNRKRDPKWLSSRQASAPLPGKRVASSSSGRKNGSRLEKKREIWRIKSASSSLSKKKRSEQKRATTGGLTTGGGLGGLAEGMERGMGVKILGAKVDEASPPSSSSKPKAM